MKKNNIIPLLWTGGWDSTFRLLQLVIEKGCLVEPYYILNPKRKSLQNELKAMDNIRNTIEHKYPNKQNHILCTNYISLYDMPDDKEIKKAFSERSCYIVM